MYLVSLDPADPYPKFVKTRSGPFGQPSPREARPLETSYYGTEQ